MIGKILLILLQLIIFLLLTASVVYHIKLNKIEKQLDEEGFYQPVSVGDHALNV